MHFSRRKRQTLDPRFAYNSQSYRQSNFTTHKNCRKKTLLSVVFAVIQLHLYAQTLTGQVQDKNSQEPISGVSVLVKNTLAGAEGKFTLTNLSRNDVLVFSYIGFRTQEIPYTGQKS